jgi:hypothetical protein
MECACSFSRASPRNDLATPSPRNNPPKGMHISVPGASRCWCGHSFYIGRNTSMGLGQGARLGPDSAPRWARSTTSAATRRRSRRNGLDRNYVGSIRQPNRIAQVGKEALSRGNVRRGAQ